MARSQNSCALVILAIVGIQGILSMPSTNLHDASGSTSNFTCPENGNVAPSYHPHPVKCELYYGCTMSNGYVPVLHNCPHNQLFSLVYSGCDWADRTHCGERERPEGYPPTAQPPQTTAKPYPCPGNEPDVTFADPENCKAYYRCVYGVSYHYVCGDPLVFNDVKKECDWRQNVNCGSRP